MMKVDLEGLVLLRNHAIAAGTLAQWSNVALQYAQGCNDEIERLRGEWGEALGRSNRYACEAQTAEAEIERLRAALESIASSSPKPYCTPEMLRTIARQALAAKAAGGE